LIEANRIRRLRARFKRDVKAGRRSVLEVVLEVPEDFETMRVLEVILAVPKVGRTKANKVMVQGRISPSKTLGGMTERQRVELASFLRGWGA